jgi:hypothetical protein
LPKASDSPSGGRLQQRPVGSQVIPRPIQARRLRNVLLACDLTPFGHAGLPSIEVGGCEDGWAGQAAFAVLAAFFWGFLAGFLIAG